MKNKKLFAAALTAALAVSMMGTSVMASTSSTGTTNFTYTPGTAGPVDPVNPGDEETSVNNWMVAYPRSITLTDSNVEAGDTFAKGATVTFTVKQKQAGSDGSDAITSDNIPQGIIVEAGGADADGNYDLSATSRTEKAKMQLAGFDGRTKITNTTDEMGTLTHGGGETQSGKAVIRDNASVVEGNDYNVNVTFTFTNPGRI